MADVSGREHRWVEPPPSKRDASRATFVCAHCDSAASGPVGWFPDPVGYCGQLTEYVPPSPAAGEGVVR